MDLISGIISGVVNIHKNSVSCKKYNEQWVETEMIIKDQKQWIRKNKNKLIKKAYDSKISFD